MGRVRDDGGAVRAGELARCLRIQSDDLRIPAADDEQRGGLHLAERIAGQIGASAAGDDRVHALRALGRGDQPSFRIALEAAALLSVVLLAVLDLAGASNTAVGLAAFTCAAVHAIRTARWRGWRVADQPLLASLHLAFAWLIAAFALKAAAELTGVVPAAAWLHAFTVGALGLMMLGLMNRVALRHTGRALEVPPVMRIAYLSMFAAALLRLAATVHGLGYWAIALAALLWAMPFVIYLALYGATLLQPSLPRMQPLRPT